MDILITITFILGYTAIAFEQPLGINKTSSAILTGVLCWVIYILGSSNNSQVNDQLYNHFGEISSILFFLLCAMTIVEIIDSHDGFEVITSKIKTRDQRKLLWIVGFVAFFLSAVLDNLTTTIVMVSLLRKLISDRTTRMYFVGMVVIAANAGGAWSPIGDVTTTMLWIGGQITTSNIMVKLFFPSLVCLLLPLLVLSLKVKGKTTVAHVSEEQRKTRTSSFEQKLILTMGAGAFVFVPVFKALTDLPPFMGILFGLGVLWLVTEIIHRGKNEEDKDVFSVAHALRKADVPTVLFFLGILVAIAALESTQQLSDLATIMEKTIGNVNIIVISIGLFSAIIDNVPLVAATMGMYDLQLYPADSYLWEFIAYCAGTGGSCLIIGSAAGVAAMGMEKIDFIWYLKKISFIALLGYFGGALAYILQHYLLHM
jgi:Na+/H+ antiporter NhaD/arsenite permease-like protein